MFLVNRLKVLWTIVCWVTQQSLPSPLLRQRCTRCCSTCTQHSPRALPSAQAGVTCVAQDLTRLGARMLPLNNPHNNPHNRGPPNLPLMPGAVAAQVGAGVNCGPPPPPRHCGVLHPWKINTEPLLHPSTHSCQGTCWEKAQCEVGKLQKVPPSPQR